MEISFDSKPSAFGISMTVALLTGCSGVQTPVAPSLPTQQNISATVRADHKGSWMLPEASGEDLLYVSNDNATVTVYSYPTGKLVGTLRGPFDVPEGECVDKAGDVFVTVLDLHEIVEYAHGGSKPIATLSDSNRYPVACSADATTGNLAVVNGIGISSSQGISIYRDAKGKPRVYQAQNMSDYGYCGYDNKGNLYVNGDGDSAPVLDELPKGASKFETISLDVGNLLGGVQWDGDYLAVGDGGISGMAIYQFKIVGGKGTKVKSTTLKGSNTYMFWIEGNKVAALNDHANIGIWNYPAGGSPTETIYQGVFFPNGVTISPTTNR